MSEADHVAFDVATIVGGLLALVGVVAYIASDFASATALIPSIFGIAIVALGSVGRNTERKRLAIYGLALFALLGLVGSVQGVGDVLTVVAGGSVDRPVAAVSQTITVVLCIALLVLIGRSMRTRQ